MVIMKFSYVSFDSDNDDEVVVIGSNKHVRKIVRMIYDDIRCGIFYGDNDKVEGVCYRVFDGNWESKGRLKWEVWNRNFEINFDVG